MEAPLLDLHLSISNYVSTKIYDKRDLGCSQF